MFAIDLKIVNVAGGSYTFSTAKNGQVMVTDIGDKRFVRKETWGALINHGQDAYEFGYEGGGHVNLTIAENGTLSISGGSLHKLKYVGQ